MFGCPENSLCTSMSLSVCLRKICERMIFGRIRSQESGQRHSQDSQRDNCPIYPGMPSSCESATHSDFWVMYGREDGWCKYFFSEATVIELYILRVMGAI